MRPDGNGKGDKPRPFSVPKEQFDSNWDMIFKKKPVKEQNESSGSNANNRQSKSN